MVLIIDNESGGAVIFPQVVHDHLSLGIHHYHREVSTEGDVSDDRLPHLGLVLKSSELQRYYV